MDSEIASVFAFSIVVPRTNLIPVAYEFWKMQATLIRRTLFAGNVILVAVTHSYVFARLGVKEGMILVMPELATLSHTKS